MKKRDTDVQIAPIFRRLLVNQEIREGGIVRFDVGVEGHPEVNLEWEKDGQPLKTGPRHEIEWESENLYYLLVRDVSSTDAGVYKLTAKNIAGSCSCCALLKVLPYVHKDHSK